MIKITSILKVLLLTILVSFAYSCDDDEDIVSSPADKTDNNDSLTQKIVANSQKVHDSLKKVGQHMPLTFSNWDLGSHPIVVEIENDKEIIQVGRGQIEASGDFSYTLDGTLSKKFMMSPLTFIKDIDRGNFGEEKVFPEDLLMSYYPTRVYALINNEKKEIFCRTHHFWVDSVYNEFWVNTDYTWSFFSKQGNINVDAYQYITDYYGKYTAIEIDCNKGWNLLKHQDRPVQVFDVSKITDKAVYYIETEEKGEEPEDPVYKDIVADPITLSGKMEIFQADKQGMYDWNLGEQIIIAELSTRNSTIQLGKGSIEASGKFSITLTGTLSTKDLKTADKFSKETYYDIKERIIEPEDLYLSQYEAKIYVSVNNEKKQIFNFSRLGSTTDSSGNELLAPDSNIYWRFFSANGRFKIIGGYPHSLKTPYDITFTKGWNLIYYNEDEREYRNTKLPQTQYDRFYIKE